MNKKVFIAICGCVLLVGATVFVMVELNVDRDKQNVFEDSKSGFESEIESTTLVDSLQQSHVVGASINEPFVPVLVIDAPVQCKPGEIYSSLKKKCLRNL